MRVIGLDVHRSFAVSAILEGGQLRLGERVILEHNAVVAFARTLRPDDEVVLEATGNTAAVARLLAPHVRKVAIANPVQVRAICLGQGEDRQDRCRRARQAARERVPARGLVAG